MIGSSPETAISARWAVGVPQLERLSSAVGVRRKKLSIEIEYK